MPLIIAVVTIVARPLRITTVPLLVAMPYHVLMLSLLFADLTPPAGESWFTHPPRCNMFLVRQPRLDMPQLRR